MPKPKKVNNGFKKVTSIYDLRCKCSDDPLKDKYQQLAVIASDNLGGPKNPTIDQCINWFNTNAQEVENAAIEIGESINGDKSVTDEINFCIDLVK